MAGPVALQRPRADLAATDLPVAELPAGTPVWRSHRNSRNPWWFSSTGQGRFDLTPPQGTLYTADDVTTCVRERLRGEVLAAGFITEALARSFTLTRLLFTQDQICVNVSDDAAAGFGVTRELVTTTDYHLTGLWAEFAAAAGRDGIRYASRFTTGRPTAWALFGPAGTPGSPLGTVAETIPGLTACRTAGIRVTAIASSAVAFTQI